MAEGLLSRAVSRLARKMIRQAVDSRLAEELNTVLVNYKIRPKEKEIFTSEAQVQQHLQGYSDGQLNEYIIAKSARWLEGLDASTFTFPPHLYSLLWVVQTAQGKLGAPIRILDFGGGAPTIPLLLRQLGMGPRLGSYRIVESPAFVERVLPAWQAACDYASSYDGSEGVDLLILSSVLPYLPKALTDHVLATLAAHPPRFLYFGRTSFLDENYPADEALTIQESRFKDHGAQVDVGMAHLEDNMARYVKRHIKWSAIARVIEPLGYRMVLALSDDSGLENIKGLGLYANNSLWERT